jgi:hypothetical protein
MQDAQDPTIAAVEARLAAAEAAGDEERLRALEQLRAELESALAEGEGEQAGAAGR